MCENNRREATLSVTEYLHIIDIQSIKDYKTKIILYLKFYINSQ